MQSCTYLTYPIICSVWQRPLLYTGKTAKFSDTECRIPDGKKKLIAMGTRVGSLYYHYCLTSCHRANVTEVVFAERQKRRCGI